MGAELEKEWGVWMAVEQKLEFQVECLLCAARVAKVERALTDIAFVDTAHVNLATG